VFVAPSREREPAPAFPPLTTGAGLPAPISPAPVPTAPVTTAPTGSGVHGSLASRQPEDTPSTTAAAAPPQFAPPSGASGLAVWTTVAVLAVLAGVVVGAALLVNLLLSRVQFHLNRPRLRESTSAYPTGSRSSTPLDVTLTTTPSEIVVRAGAASGLRRRSRWNRPVTLLLGQRHGNVGSQVPEELARQLARTPGAEALYVRFRQSRPPLTWRLWEDAPGAGSAIGADYRGPPQLAPVVTSPPRRALDRRSVLHLVGTPVATAAGWRLRIPAAASSSQGYEQQSRGVHVGEELVGADDLAVESTALVVVQAEPVDGPPQPLGEQYGGMCALAADIRDAGAGAVLVVPPLPDHLARAVVAMVRDQLTARRHKLHPVHVLDLAQQVKDDVNAADLQMFDFTHPSSRDVLLFA